ncbi:SH3 domain-containing protein C23A1.17-like [Cryptomeria japonica]|uniref:SH3 domain-containing protein C23A1.17-like n=1 Tax=Cryptomeria japonica TaxID=3369 RepID=UPI0027DA5E8C|nr:SH3 domain-containing protein C23A1.17-like [Cryptomeria japonica]
MESQPQQIIPYWHLTSPTSSFSAGTVLAPGIPVHVGIVPVPAGTVLVHAGTVPVFAGTVPIHVPVGSVPVHVVPVPVGIEPIHVGTVPVLAGTIPVHVGTVPIPVVPVHVGTVPVPVGIVPVHAGIVLVLVVPVPKPAVLVPIPCTVTSFFPSTASSAIAWSAILVSSMASDASTTRLICGSDTCRCASGSPSLIFRNNTPTGRTSPTRLAIVSASCGTKCVEDNFGGVNFTLVLFHCARSPPCRSSGLNETCTMQPWN